MFGKYIKVDCKVVALSNMSAHADYEEMLNWVGKFKTKPKKVFITHGEPKAAESLREKIEERFGWDCVVPDYLQMEQL